MATDRTTTPLRGLGPTAAIAVNIANIIGTGVFLKARVMTCNVGTPGKAIAVWIFAGLLALAGGLTMQNCSPCVLKMPVNMDSFAMRMESSGDSFTVGRNF
jgi:hypothetical protein